MQMDEFEVDQIGNMLDDDEISSGEEGFMRGYDHEERLNEDIVEEE
jgi:hypothetical protein